MKDGNCKNCGADLGGREALLEAKRKQLKSNLNKNSRLRYFVISRNAIESFNDEIVNFIQEYLEKYHFKEAHISTPLFCLDCPPEEYEEIRIRIHKKGLSFTDGFVAGSFFDEKHFFREPVASKQKGSEYKVEFRLRVLRYDDNNKILWERSCDDMFVVSDKVFDEVITKDVNMESLGINTFRELKYILGMSDSYE